MKAYFQKHCLLISNEFAVSYDSSLATVVLLPQNSNSDSQDVDPSVAPLTNWSILTAPLKSTSDSSLRGQDLHNLPALSPPSSKIGRSGSRRRSSSSYPWRPGRAHLCTTWSWTLELRAFVGRSLERRLCHPNLVCRSWPYRHRQVELRTSSCGTENRRSFECLRFSLWRRQAPCFLIQMSQQIQYYVHQ